MTLGNANYQFKDYPSLPLPEERRFESIKISLELPAVSSCSHLMQGFL